MLNLRGIWSGKIETPHVPLGIPISDALDILKNAKDDISKTVEDEEVSYKISTEFFEVAVYEKNGIASSVWYNDPTGRLTFFGKRKKIKLYLARYGQSSNWEKRMNNVWITFFFNDTDKLAMAYGNDMDVIRFNQNV